MEIDNEKIMKVKVKIIKFSRKYTKSKINNSGADKIQSCESTLKTALPFTTCKNELGEYPRSLRFKFLNLKFQNLGHNYVNNRIF